MVPLLSSEGVGRLRVIARPGMLCAFDFDGTLAPIVPWPDQAYMPKEVADRLARLAERAPIAIITGRSLADIQTRLPFVPDFVVGNHGMEGLPGWEARAARHAQLCAGWLQQLDDMLRNDSHAQGMTLENKHYSLSVHYREAPDAERAQRYLSQRFDALVPRPRVVSGKAVFNLTPEDASHKGNAWLRVIEISGARSALFAGDDVTDEDAFGIKRDGLLSVRIEASATSVADCYLPGFSAMTELLDLLVERLAEQGAHNWLRGGGRLLA